MEHQHPAGGPMGLLEMIERSPVGEAMRSSLWLFPAVETLHILGFSLLIGSIAAYDLRLLMAKPLLPADHLGRLLLPVAVTGFLIAVPAGLLLFTSEATAFAENPMFWIKMGLLAVGLVNIVVFHNGIGRHMESWADLRPPPAARVAGAVSLIAWIGVLICGRLIAYV